jgi:predicted nucleotidyltransferase
MATEELTMIDAKTIQQSVDAILAACPDGTRVILFGSRSRGDAAADSDVDFMVIQPTVQSPLAESARLMRVIRKLRVPADIVVVSHDTFEQWRDLPNSVCHEAAREGRVFA